ncbi:uncharacterized protein [Branchiostoma lanceolatum]|uniref:Hypp3156 protein n=1 Tax=Branchiostoma lanceolatum TaxID=7740 RepID=A0A8J9ZYM8_BRALA|nr:Hypp3156 [Branchiostoma lanceolatum]
MHLLAVLLVLSGQQRLLLARGEPDIPGKLHIGPEDWLRNFTNATEERDFDKLQHLLTYVVEKAGDKELDQDILASLKVMQSVGYVNRNATYWDELNQQVKQIMYQLGLEREPQVPRKRAKKARRRGPRMSNNHRSHVEL